MPIYSSAPPVTSIYPGDTATIVNGEILTTGQASQQLAIGYIYSMGYPSVSVLISFASTPGTFEVDIQQADVDAAGNYSNVSVGAVINQVDATNFNWRVDLAPFLGKFIRVLMKTQSSNSVKMTAQVSTQ